MIYYKNKEGILFPSLSNVIELMCKQYAERDDCNYVCPIGKAAFIGGCYGYATSHEKEVIELLELEKVEVEIRPYISIKWIPVDDALPQPPEDSNIKRGFYLVRMSDNVVKVLAYEFDHYDNDIIPVGWHETPFPVTHWMEIPEFV